MNSPPSPVDIKQQLERLRNSETFAGSERLMAFLTYLVEETLAGRGDGLREAVIGNAVYRRDPPYDPRIDSTVRVEARRLRNKLADYFAGEGRRDAVHINIPTGSYGPQFSKGNSASHDAVRGDNAQTFKTGAGATLAVIPFRALALDPAVKVFADGLTDELIYFFGLEPGIRVPSRSMVFPYAEGRQQPAAIAAEIGVDAVLQGTVREEDARLKVTIELSDRNGFVVLSDRFEGPAEHRQQLQARIAATLLSRVRLDNSRMRDHELSPSPAALEAHAKVYRARRLLDRQTPASIRQAMAMFRSVAAAAPDYARGFSGIADCYCDLYRIGMIDRGTALTGATEAAGRALLADGRSAEAYTSLATIAAWLERDRKKAEELFGKAAELGNTPRAARVYGVFLTILGRGVEAERLFAEAREIEPYCEQQDIAETISRYQSRNFELLRNPPDETASESIEVVFHIALADHFGGAGETALVAAGRMAKATITHPALAFAPAELEAWLGRPEEARKILELEPQAASHFAYATLAASVGDGPRACRHLRSALENRELATVWMRSDIRFDAFRAMPAFAALLEMLDAQRAS